MQLLLASGSRQEGGHGGTSPFRHSSALTCTRPCPQSGVRERRMGTRQGGRHEAQRRASQPPTPHAGAPLQTPPAARLRSPVPPAQGCRPQGALSWGAPGQGAPPFLGGGSTQLLRRLRWPPPHETLQGPQASHSAHAPATAAGRKKNGGEPGGEPQELQPPRESRAKGPGSLRSGQRGGLGQRPEDSAASSRVPGKPP